MNVQKLTTILVVDSIVGDLRIPRRIGEDRGGVIGSVHHSPVKIWAAEGWAA